MPPHARTLAPLQQVERITVSHAAGEELNRHYHWLTREYTLALTCGHTQVRARLALGDPAPELLDPPLPKRVRCPDCPPAPSRGRGPKPRPTPRFDPVVGALVSALCRAMPAQQDPLLEWVERYGRWIEADTRRHRAYGAMALTAIENYLADTTHPQASAVHAAVATWTTEPTSQHRAEIRRASQRLYNTQHRHGDWYAHRGILTAAKITSPAPHNREAIVEAPTWDNPTRSHYYNQLRTLRVRHDAARTAETDALVALDGHGVDHHSQIAEQLAAELRRTSHTQQPVLGPQHHALAQAMLAAYQDTAAP